MNFWVNLLDLRFQGPILGGLQDDSSSLDLSVAIGIFSKLVTEGFEEGDDEVLEGHRDQDEASPGDKEGSSHAR